MRNLITIIFLFCFFIAKSQVGTQEINNINLKGKITPYNSAISNSPEYVLTEDSSTNKTAYTRVVQGSIISIDDLADSLSQREFDSLKAVIMKTDTNYIGTNKIYQDGITDNEIHTADTAEFNNVKIGGEELKNIWTTEVSIVSLVNDDDKIVLEHNTGVDKFTITNTVSSAAFYAINQGSGDGFEVQNTSSGRGFTVQNISSGDCFYANISGIGSEGLHVNISGSSCDAIVVDNLGGTKGNVLTGRKSGVDAFKIDGDYVITTPLDDTTRIGDNFKVDVNGDDVSEFQVTEDTIFVNTNVKTDSAYIFPDGTKMTTAAFGTNYGTNSRIPYTNTTGDGFLYDTDFYYSGGTLVSDRGAFGDLFAYDELFVEVIRTHSSEAVTSEITITNDVVIDSSLNFSGAYYSGKVITITSDYVLTNSDQVHTILMNSECNLTLPDATTNDEREIQIKKIDSDTGSKIHGISSQKIDDSDTVTFYVHNQSMTVKSDGTQWRAITKQNPNPETLIYYTVPRDSVVKNDLISGVEEILGADGPNLFQIKKLKFFTAYLDSFVYDNPYRPDDDTVMLSFESHVYLSSGTTSNRPYEFYIKRRLPGESVFTELEDTRSYLYTTNSGAIENTGSNSEIFVKNGTALQYMIISTDGNVEATIEGFSGIVSEIRENK